MSVSLYGICVDVYTFSTNKDIRVRVITRVKQ